MKAYVDSHHAGRRSALSTRRRVASRLTIRTKSARPPARSSFPHATLRTHNRPQTSPCTSRSMKGLNTRPSTTKKAGEKRKSTTTTTTTTITLQPHTLNSNSSRNNASPIKHSCTTSPAITFTAHAHCHRQRRSSLLRTDTRDPCIKESYLTPALLMYLRSVGNNTSP
jgi:hypothetical protein